MASTSDDSPAVRNLVLSSMAPAELDELRPRLTRVQLVHGQILHEAGERIEHAFFVEQGMISLMAEANGPASSVEVGMIGREGAVGATAVFDAPSISFNRVMVQMPGHGLRIPASDLRDAAEASPTLRAGLHRSLQVVLAQSSQTAACNARHTLVERCARWLLTAHDLMDGDELPLTQDFISVMLAVRRSGVTVAMGALQQAGLVQNSRGRVIVVDRAGLKGVACSCHGRVRAFADALWSQKLSEAS